VRLVLDTNTVVSGLLWKNTPSRLIDAGLQGRIELFTTQPLLLELEDVLPRQKLAQRVAASGLSVVQLVARYALLARSVEPAIINRISADPDDDQVLACALAAQSDLIVSGDAHLLNLKVFQRIPIITAAEAVNRITQSSGE
jgi:putative PIN family toxin of toxin-antitoxin system